jgi:hypothetical protein
MKIEDVPQDNSRAFAGERKALYAVDAEGNYTITVSNGWEAEDIVLELALTEFREHARAALLRVRTGKASPLEYHMYSKRMDAKVLSQSSGFFLWKVRRHCKPAVFARLPQSKLARYAEALGISVSQLQEIPDEQSEPHG